MDAYQGGSRRGLRAGIGLLVALAFLPLLGRPAGAAAPLFQDSFSGEPSGATPAGWNASHAEFIANGGGNGWATDTQTVAGWMTAGSSGWSDITASADLRFDSTSSQDILLAVRWQTYGNFYGCGLTASKELALVVKKNGTVDHGKWVAMPGGFAVGQWYAITLTATGSTLSCSVAGGPSATLQDSTWPTGAVGIYNYGGLASVDNVSVSAVTTATPTPAPAPQGSVGTSSPASPSASAAPAVAPAAAAAPGPSGSGGGGAPAPAPPAAGFAGSATSPEPVSRDAAPAVYAGALVAASDPTAPAGFLMPGLNPVGWAVGTALVLLLTALVLHRYREWLSSRGVAPGEPADPAGAVP